MAREGRQEKEVSDGGDGEIEGKYNWREKKEKKKEGRRK